MLEKYFDLVRNEQTADGLFPRFCQNVYLLIDIM